MPDAYTSQASTGFSQNVYSKAIIWPFRDENVFDAIATTRSTTEGGFRGKGVTHTFINDLPLATTPIDEIVGPDAVTFSTSTKTFGLEEYANTMKSTALARTTGFVDLDAALANLIGQNAGASMDVIAATALAGTTNIQRANGRTTNVGVTATDVLTTKELEIAYTELDAANVAKVNGNYWLIAHPYQVHDLRQEVGAGGWREAREQGGNDFTALTNRTVGQWAGFNIVTSNRTPLTLNAGAGATVDIFRALALGGDALAKSHSDHPEAPGATPQVRFGLATDALMRNRPVSWYHLVSYDILRDASVRAIYTSSSRATNV